MTVALAAAGTGGHVYPALAVAEALVKRGVRREQVVFFGGSRLEATEVPAAGYPLLWVEVTGLRRSLSPRNLKLPAVVSRASRKIHSELRARRVRVMLAMGGYVTVPAALAARRSGIPLFVQEQNAIPGLATRFASRRARKTFIAFPEAARRLRRTKLVGNPLREALAQFDRAELRPSALERYGLEPGLPVLGVLGGSLGAQVLNEMVVEMARSWEGPDLAIVHLTGRAAAEQIARAAEGSRLPWRAVSFEEDMQFFYAASDLVLCRAGAMTVSELSATGTPAVLVPLARVGQDGNAAYLAEAGAAVVIPARRLEEVPSRIGALVADVNRLERIRSAALGTARLDAADRIADALLEAVGD
ncbi:MAG: undecaprenyldiphospho-muramoylpentapeptide beta-N-acetylglucosaminyltransferase [Acidimicrobiia bacterium]